MYVGKITYGTPMTRQRRKFEKQKRRKRRLVSQCLVSVNVSGTTVSSTAVSVDDSDGLLWSLLSSSSSIEAICGNGARIHDCGICSTVSSDFCRIVRRGIAIVLARAR